MVSKAVLLNVLLTSRSIWDKLGQNLIFYTDGSMADVTSGAISSLRTKGVSPTLVAAGGPTVSNGVLTFDGTDDVATPASITTQTATLAIQSAITPVLPSSGATALTGLDRLPNGNWIVGNDGRVSEGGGTGSNADASVLIYAPDFQTIVSETKAADLGITPNGTIQGVAYIPISNQIAFYHGGAQQVYFLNADTLTLDGTLAGGPYAVNGVGYDVDMDAIITLSIISAVWRRRSDGTTLRSVTVSGDSSNDMIRYNSQRRSVFYTSGSNGGTGRLYETRASYTANAGGALSNFTLTGANAIEGFYIDGDTLYVVNDAGFHGGSPATTRILIYTLPSLNSQPKWPFGTTYEMFGRIRVPSAPSTNMRVLMGMGASLTATTGGIGVFVPSGTTTTFRLIFNNQTKDWTVSNLTTERRFFLSVDPVNETASLWIDGSLVSTQSLTATVPDLVDPSPPIIGAYTGGSRYFPGEVRKIGAAVNSLGYRAEIERALAA